MTRACLPEMIAKRWGPHRQRRLDRRPDRDRRPCRLLCLQGPASSALRAPVALEGAPHGVTCTAVSPTWVETDMLRQSAATMAANKATTLDEEIAGLAAANPQKPPRPTRRDRRPHQLSMQRQRPGPDNGRYTGERRGVVVRQGWSVFKLDGPNSPSPLKGRGWEALGTTLRAPRITSKRPLKGKEENNIMCQRIECLALAPLDPEHGAVGFFDEQVGQGVADVFGGELRSCALELA